MNKDILGKAELENLKIDWGFATPGLMSGRCCATGTCEYKPILIRADEKQEIISHNFLFQGDTCNPKEITNKYGYLR